MLGTVGYNTIVLVHCLCTCKPYRPCMGVANVVIIMKSLDLCVNFCNQFSA